MNISPTLPYLTAVSIISASALAYEVLLMRLFSIIYWHHFAYMIISLALLGYGISGVVLALNREYFTRNYSTVIMINLLLFGISMPICFLFGQQIPFNSAEVLWAPVQLWYLCCIYLLLTLPFLFAANIIGLSFYYYKHQVASIYAADLLGAGIGSVGIIVLLLLMFPEKVLTLLPMVIMLTGLLISNYCFDWQRIKILLWNGACITVAVIIVLLVPIHDELLVSPYKSQSQLLTLPATSIVDKQSSPLGLVTVVKSDTVPLRHAPGLSINSNADLPEQFAVFTDADNMAAITAFDGDVETLRYLDQTTSALPYHLTSLANVLILGSGTGSDVLQALFHNINDIDAVEQNRQIVDLISERYAAFAGNIYSPSKVNVHLNEARGYVASSTKNYDLISMSLMDAFGASAAGVYSMAENYLYTEQAIAEYMQHLNRDGYLSLTRWIKLPPRDMPKLLATVIAAFKKQNITEPEHHIMVIRNWQTSTLVVKNGKVTTDEIRRMKDFCLQRRFDLVFYPGISEHEVNKFHMTQQPYFYQAAIALVGEDNDKFIDAYKFNIEPVSDDKPYFSQFFKWRTFPEIISLLGRGGLFLLEGGYLLLISALIQAIAASLLLIVLPLILWKHKLGIKPNTVNYKSVLIYFFCLGLAFLFIEIAFIQKFILLLHHPIYAITTVLCTFLLSAGAGSYFSKKLSGFSLRSMVNVPIIVIGLLSIMYIVSFESITAFMLGQRDISRYLLSVLLIIPLGFFMGMPFPMALGQLSHSAPALIPWAWGVNGFASVISAILATLIAMEFGFSVLVALAVVLYAIAAWFFPDSTDVRGNFQSINPGNHRASLGKQINTVSTNS